MEGGDIIDWLLKGLVGLMSFLGINIWNRVAKQEYRNSAIERSIADLNTKLAHHMTREEFKDDLRDLKSELSDSFKRVNNRLDKLSDRG